MKKKLKIKIFASFMLLTAMLALAGLVSIIGFRGLSSSVHGLIHDNYKTIEASKTMIEALEREDSGILLLLLGEWEEGRNTLDEADKTYREAFRIAENNLTEANEEQYIARIEEKYTEFKSAWERPIVDTDREGNIAWYKENIHKAFLDTKKAVNDLMFLNQKSMYEESSDLQDKSRRAIMPGIVMIIAAIVFSLLLNFFITRYFVRPIYELAQAVKNYQPGDMLHTQVTSNDEIKLLEEEVRKALDRIEKKE